MKIDNDHMYHGAALIQIAEHPQFTSINSFKIRKTVIEHVYEINDGIGVHLKYASKPIGRYKEYVFGFSKDNLLQLEKTHKKLNRLFLALVCVKDREICNLTYEKLLMLIKLRKKEKGSDEEQYYIIVTVPKGKGCRVYINAPGAKNTVLGNKLIISRTDFPDSIFG